MLIQKNFKKQIWQQVRPKDGNVTLNKDLLRDSLNY